MSSRSRTTPLAIAALLLAVPLASAAEKKRAIDPAACAAYENSVQQVPDWYADVCMGGNAVRDYSSYTELPGLVPGDIAFYKVVAPAPLVIKTAPLPTFTFSTVGPNSQVLFAMSFNTAANTLYAIDNNSRQLGTINESTGAFTPIAAVNPDPGPAFSALGLAFDATQAGQGYVSFTDGAATGALLYRIDVANAALTLVGPITGMGFAIDLAIDAAGQMWSHDIGTDTLVRIDKNTGTPTVVGPTGMNANFAQGMMYDHSDNSLYGCAFVVVPALQGQLVRFNTSTGAATVLAGPVPDELECSLKRAAGGGCTAPAFAGIQTATSAGTANCAINLSWNAGTPCPGTSLKYNVYRSTTPSTPPSAATLIASCLTTTTYQDTTAVGGTTYYYKVRAEDSSTGGSGPCNGGITDTNNAERAATPTGPSTTVTDTVENGNPYWSTAGGTGANVWSIVTTQSNSPTHSWFVADPATVSDQRLATLTAADVPAGFVLSFFHRYNTEVSTPPVGYDGHVLEYSLDGVNWVDILAGTGPIPPNATRFLQNGYTHTISTGFQNPLGGRQAWSGDNAAFQEVRVNMADFAGQVVYLRFRFGSDNSVSDVGVWIDDITVRVPGSCTTVPTQGAAAFALVVDSAGNGVYQPGETVVVAPTWRNIGSSAITLTGALTNHTGPVGPTYSIPDAAASYGTIAPGTNASCTAAGNCYAVANSTATRPATHWDSTVVETVTPTATAKTWTLHVGNSFTDVSGGPFFRYIETLLHRGVTGGCTATAYCPSNSTTREQMAVFVLISKEGAAYNPPACVAGAEQFADVPASSPFCKWIEELFNRGVVAGCGGGNYCPTNAVNREQMAVFVLRTLDPALNPPACVPPNIYADVPETSPFCRWIEELTNRSVVTGCGGGNYCPTASVTREQMGVFLAVTFSLSLYGL